MEFPKAELPNHEKKLLLASCCGPCSCYALSLLKYNNIDVEVLFYNPNIHPKKEYEKRKEENKCYAQKLGFKFSDLDYEPEVYLEQVRKAGLENEPERGKRCDLCFFMRLRQAAEYAVSNGYKIFSSTFGISRWKDYEQVLRAAKRVVVSYPNLIHWDYNFRKLGGEDKRAKIVRESGMYNQDYCGCIYSKKDFETK
jgi:hypothetical protein